MAKFTSEEKLQAVARYLQGNESYRELGRSLGLDFRHIHKWVKQFKHNGVEAFIKRCTSYTQRLNWMY